jgi:glycosyltransferase involved in cell wall biosynthesis
MLPAGSIRPILLSIVISVIIPAYNAATTLGEQLEAVANQDCSDAWEVVVADNGSTDDTAAVVTSFSSQLANLQLVDASARRGAAPARNIGADAAHGDYLVFCDADDVVAPGWLQTMADALGRHQFVTGGIDHKSLNPGEEGTHWRSHVTSIPTALHFKPYALSGNMGVTRAAFEAIGGFPEDLGTVGEDVAISWALQLAGYDLYFEPRAVIAYRHRHSSGSLWRQHRNFGRADPVLYKRFRSQGVPRQQFRSVLAAYVRLILRVPTLISARGRSSFTRSAAKRWGRLQGSIRERVFYL